ncbi:MAG: adenylate/guanylate cyclase domain-containing protein [Pseudomonadota bacterium]
MRRLIHVTAIVTVISAVMGGLIGALQAQTSLGWSVLTGMVTGASIAAGCTGVEIGLLSNTQLRLVRRLPPLVLALLRGVLYSAVILGGMMLAQSLVGAPMPWQQDGFGAQFALSCAIAAVFSTGIEVVRFLGREASWALVSVRYTQPRLEERVVMFADVSGSTALGEQLGALGFHRFLSEVALDLARPINDAGGQVHRYVGDAVIVTWPRAAGARACLDCARAMHGALDQAAPRYQRRHGAVPRIRIALHVGEVAAGEMGDWKKEITLLGDVMNTTARIEAAAKNAGAATVLSDELVQLMGSAQRAGLVPLPDTPLDGKAAPLALWRDGGAAA